MFQRNSLHSEHLYPLRPFILIDTKIVGGPGKGLFQFLRCARHAAPHGFEPTVAHFCYSDEPTEFELRAEAEGVPLLSLPARSPIDREALALAAATMRARGCNAIQSHGYKSHLYAAFLKNLIAVPWVAFAHGWTAENAKVRLYHSLDRLLLPRADAVVAVSQTLYTTIRAWRGSGSPTVLIENGVDAPPKAEAAVRAEIRNAIGVTPNDIVVGAFGRLSAEKGHRFLLEAFNAVAQDERNLSLLIIGSGPERRILEELKHRGPAPARITFLPHTSDIGRYFEAIDLLALPSLSEGLPNVLLEAMSHSLPVIATAVGAVPTVLKSGCNGLVVPPHDPGRLGEALRQLSRDGSLRTKLGAAGKSSLYPRFSPIERARAILFLYRALVSPRRFDYPQAAAAHL